MCMITTSSKDRWVPWNLRLCSLHCIRVSLTKFVNMLSFNLHWNVTQSTFSYVSSPKKLRMSQFDSGCPARLSWLHTTQDRQLYGRDVWKRQTFVKYRWFYRTDMPDYDCLTDCQICNKQLLRKFISVGPYINISMWQTIAWDLDMHVSNTFIRDSSLNCTDVCIKQMFVLNICCIIYVIPSWTA